ncbi:putative enterotoxin [Ophiocordyceps australis]|uniref:Putative enterotoxin n=1 Tax=Ophiocordyceps australis TaxID=1399860 RepID=A0A2C5XWI2_9HYPO|nr:putative enterotoxin [Ophiocordyceps australis]
MCLTYTKAAALLWLMWLQLSGTSLGYQTSRRPAKIVYRGDYRPPQDVRNAGGFWPSGKYQDDALAFSIPRHMEGDDVSIAAPNSTENWTTAFVSVSDNVTTAARHGHWIYTIRATPNMLDPNPDNAPETEIFALGGIQWTQVIGYQFLDTARQKRTKFLRSPDYRRDSFQGTAVTLLVPSGFYRDEGLQAAVELMNRSQVGSLVGWTGKFPLSFEPLAPRDKVPFWGFPPKFHCPLPFLEPSHALNDVDMLAAADYLVQERPECSSDQQDVNEQQALSKMHDLLEVAVWGLPTTGFLRQIIEAEEPIKRVFETMVQDDGICALVEACESIFDGNIEMRQYQRGFRKFCRKSKDIRACAHVKDVELGFELSDRYFAGTYDRVGVTISGPKGKTAFEIGTGLSRGFKQWFPVNVRELGGEKTLSLTDGPLDMIFTATGHAFGSTNDAFLVENPLEVLLRGHCVGSGYGAEVKQFNNLLAWWQHDKSSTIAQRTKPQKVATLRVDASDWVTRPPCHLIDELHVHFSMSQPHYAVEYVMPALTFGVGRRIVLAKNQQHGPALTPRIDLGRSFGASVVSLRDLDVVQVVEEAKNGTLHQSHWKLESLSFWGRCADSGKVVHMDKWNEVKEALGPSGMWSGRIDINDWHG